MARYIARNRIDLGRDKDGKARTFEVGQPVEGLSDEETKQLRDSGALVEEGQQSPDANAPQTAAGTAPGATATTSPDVPQAPPGSPPPDNAKKEGQAAQRERQVEAARSASSTPTGTDPHAPGATPTNDATATRRK